VVEDQAAGPGAAAVVRLEAGRLAVPACGNLVAQVAAELAGERVQAAEPERAVVAELAMAVQSVAGSAVDLEVAAGAEGPEPAEELELQVLKARHLENGGRRPQCCTQAAPEESQVYRQ
jgi:hypothetical protein